MNIQDVDLRGYIGNPLSVEFDADIFTPEVIRRFVALFDFACALIPVRARAVNKLIEKLDEDGKIKKFPFVVKRKLKREAYMRDSGGMFISLGILLSTSRATFAAVFCHELAHIWLSQQSFYSRLKQLDKQFKTEFRGKVEDKTLVLTSPIELYARCVSVGFLRRLAEEAKSRTVKKKLLVRADEIVEKINFINIELKGLQNKFFDV